MTEFISLYGIWLVAAFIALESVGLPLPAEAALIAAGFFAARTQVLNIWCLIAAGIVAAIIGEIVGFWIGRRFGSQLLDRYGTRLGFTEGRIRIGQWLFIRYGGRFVFASEPRAFRGDPETRLEPNPRAVRDYLDQAYLDDTDETFFAGIRKLPPAHSLVVDEGGLSLTRYWTLEEDERHGAAQLLFRQRDRGNRLDHMLRPRRLLVWRSVCELCFTGHDHPGLRSGFAHVGSTSVDPAL